MEAIAGGPKRIDIGQYRTGLRPLAGKPCEGKGAVAVQVYEMPGCFVFVRIAALVGVHGVLAEVLEMLFVKKQHPRRQAEYRQAVEAAVAKEPPAIRGGSGAKQHHRRHQKTKKCSHTRSGLV